MKNRARNVAIGSIIMVALAIGSYMSFSVYIMPICTKLGITVASAVFLFSVAAIASLVTSLLLGQLLKAISVKFLVIIAGLALMLFFFAIAFASNIILIYIGAALYGFSTVVAFCTAQTTITWWYAKNTGKLIGSLQIGMGIMALVLSTSIASLIASFGVTIVAIFQGIICGGIIVLVGLFLISENPAKYNMKPVGYDESAVVVTSDGSSSTTLSLKQIMGVPSFWLIMLATVLLTISNTGLCNNAAAFYQTKGLMPVAASVCVGLFALFSIVWSPLFGVITDKFSAGVATLIFGIIAATAFFLINFISGFIGCIIFAASASTLNIAGMLGAVSLPKLFGSKEAGSLIGFSQAAGSVGAMIGAPLAGIIFTSTGSYELFMITGGIMILVTIVITLIATSKSAYAKVNEKEVELEKLNT